MSFTSVNPVSIGEATKKSHYDNVFDNSQYLYDAVYGGHPDSKSSGASAHIHDNNYGARLYFPGCFIQTIPGMFDGSNLTQLANRLHSSLQSIGANDHHNQLHISTHAPTGGDPMSDATAGYRGWCSQYQAQIISNHRADYFAVILTTAGNWYQASYAKYNGNVICHVALLEADTWAEVVAKTDADYYKEIMIPWDGTIVTYQLYWTGVVPGLKAVSFKMTSSGSGKYVNVSTSGVNGAILSCASRGITDACTIVQA